MQYNNKKKTFSLSTRDLLVMKQSRKIYDLEKMVSLDLKLPKLPPIWSKLSYMMQICQGNASSLWRDFREFPQLLKTIDSHYHCHAIPKSSGGNRNLTVPDWTVCKHQQFILKNILRLIRLH